VLLIPQAMLPAGFNANRVSIQREGRGLTALALTSQGLLVYGQGYRDDYTNKDAIFLRSTSAQTIAGAMTQAQGLFDGGQPANVTTLASATTEFHDVYFDFNLRPYQFAPWFSSKYLTDGTTQGFTLNAPSAAGGTAQLTVNLWSVTDFGGGSQDHALQVLVNGRPAGQAAWSGGNKMVQLSFALPESVLAAGANLVELVTPPIDGIESQFALVHSMTLAYTQTLDGSTPLEVTNTDKVSKLYEAANLPSVGAWVVDARFPDRAALVPYQTQANANGTFSLRFNAAPGGSGRYLVVPQGQENLPLAVTRRQVKAAKSFPYIASGPSQFKTGVQPLLMQRAKEGIRSAFVDQEELFDYYNYGRFGPDGIQKAVSSLRPQYLLLLGRTTYDYLDYEGRGVDPLCPTFLVSTTFWSQATSDSMFGDLGRGYPEVAVGRLPVNDAGELSAAVSRVLHYAGAPLSGIRMHAVADAMDPAVGDFSAQADIMAQANADLAWQRNYLGSTYQTAPEVTAAMTDAANGGADWIVYVGHGNALRLGKDSPNILDAQSMQAWRGNVVFLQATCTANWMAKNEAGYKSLAIQGLTQPQGGISASVASSTYMNSDVAVTFMNQLLANANHGGQRWGQALMRAQQWALRQGGGLYSDLGHTEQIFGDPAMPVLAAPRKNTSASVVPGAF
jgi:hypothetical protein